MNRDETNGDQRPPPAGDEGSDARRLEAIESGYRADPQGARVHLQEESPRIRASALIALHRLDALRAPDIEAAVSDPSPLVRRTLCELAPPGSAEALAVLLDDPDDRVVETCAFALGELEWSPATGRLGSIATGHSDPLCREAAVAALGAIGDPDAKPVLFLALSDVAAVRRRAVIALSRFDGPDVDAAVRERLHDRDWQVRQAVEELYELNATEEE